MTTSSHSGATPIGAEIVTLQAHILQQQTRSEEATGQFSWILSALSISAKMIAAHVRRARLDDVLGAVGNQNVQGEQQQKLDVIANEILLRTLGGREGVAIVASEENEEPVILRSDDSLERKYCVLFDPLDGSSNLDICGAVGTIFSILRKERRSPKPADSLLQPGAQTGGRRLRAVRLLDGVRPFPGPRCRHVRAGSQLWRVHSGGAATCKIPQTNKCYSVNEGNRLSFPEGYQKYLSWAQEQGYSSRYVGAMVADVHRILLQGGVFMYPPTKKAPNGKLRLMYEANPMAMLIEQAGGKAISAPGRRILDEEPSDIHQRIPVILGSTGEVDHVAAHLAAA